MMNLRVWGPFAFATMIFFIATAIRILGFDSYTFFLTMGSDFAIWATGVLFSLSATEGFNLGSRTEVVFKQKPTGTGIEIDYKAIPPNKIDWGPKLLYLFVYTMMIWILTIALGEKCTELFIIHQNYSLKIIVYAILSIVLSATSVGVAIRSLLEVAS
jgi:hypothetical protein